MMHHFSVNMTDLEVSVSSQQDTDEAISLAETRYRSWEWNFAYGPEYVFKNTFLFDNKLHSCILQVQ